MGRGEPVKACPGGSEGTSHIGGYAEDHRAGVGSKGDLDRLAGTPTDAFSQGLRDHDEHRPSATGHQGRTEGGSVDGAHDPHSRAESRVTLDGGRDQGERPRTDARGAHQPSRELPDAHRTSENGLAHTACGQVRILYELRHVRPVA
jgi:hypothetical protein